MSERAQFVTKMGVIAASVGSAVGLGNIWRFPYEAGMHGGGAFICIYLLCVFMLGIPVIIAEFVIGRATHKNANSAIKLLAPGSKFRFVSYIGIISSVMIAEEANFSPPCTIRWPIALTSARLLIAPVFSLVRASRTIWIASL